MTVEEFAKTPDPPSGQYELHHGELVLMPPPIFKHYRIQQRFMSLLDRLCTGWVVGMEFPFRPLVQYEVWRSDVGMVSEHRAKTIPESGWLEGAPDLVIEVLSPSNSSQDLLDRERVCFEEGCQEFWAVDPKSQTIRVTTVDRHSNTYRTADLIPLSRFVQATLPVAEVFAR